MENKKTITTKVKELLREAKTEKAIQMLEKEDLGKFNSDIILISGRFAELKRKEIRGIITKDDSATELNQINSSIMDLMDEVEKGPKEISIAEEVTPIKPVVSSALEKIKSQQATTSSSGNNTKKYTLISLGALLLISAIAFGTYQSNKSKQAEATKIENAKIKNIEEARTKKTQDSLKTIRAKITADSIDRAKKIFIGNQFEGGIIFHIDKSGEHGLILATSDAVIKGESKPKDLDWFNGIENPSITGATNIGLRTGKANTQLIVDYFKEGNYPAWLAKNYGPSKYKDWYLPSRDELDLVYSFYKNEKSKKSKIFKTLDFQHKYYWSSTEIGNDGVYYRSFLMVLAMIS